MGSAKLTPRISAPSTAPVGTISMDIGGSPVGYRRSSEGGYNRREPTGPMSIRAPPEKARPPWKGVRTSLAAFTGPNAQIPCSADCVAAPGDVGDALRTDMLG